MTAELNESLTASAPTGGVVTAVAAPVRCSGWGNNGSRVEVPEVPFGLFGGQTSENSLSACPTTTPAFRLDPRPRWRRSRVPQSRMRDRCPAQEVEQTTSFTRGSPRDKRIGLGC